jgi:hypothetical protein
LATVVEPDCSWINLTLLDLATAATSAISLSTPDINSRFCCLARFSATSVRETSLRLTGVMVRCARNSTVIAGVYGDTTKSEHKILCEPLYIPAACEGRLLKILVVHVTISRLDRYLLQTLAS